MENSNLQESEDYLQVAKFRLNRISNIKKNRKMRQSCENEQENKASFDPQKEPSAITREMRNIVDGEKQNADYSFLQKLQRSAKFLKLRDLFW